jgi:hypothetical protein
MADQFEEVVFVTDDRDKPDDERLSLRIIQGGNQDWYVSIAPEKSVAINGVRICTSGGASVSHPGLVSAISDAYRALHNAKHGIRQKPAKSRVELEEELAAWRDQFPNYEFNGLMIREKFQD